MAQRGVHYRRHSNATSVVRRIRASGGAQHPTNLPRSVRHRRLRSYHPRRRVTRVDFVSRLPFELVSSLILPSALMIPSRQTFAYLQVCRTWWQRVLQSVGFHFYSGARVTFGDKQIMLAYAPYITRIALGNPSELPLYFFSRSQFTCLQSLDLTCKFDTNYHT